MSGLTQKLSLSEALAAARETRALEIGTDILEITPRVFREQFSDKTAVIVTDKNTWAVAGEKVSAAFAAAKHPMEKPFIFDALDLYAEFRFVEELEASLKKHSAIPVAVGSGTINDLTKLASHRTQRPYMCVATAASMDGYTAFGASITFKGSKQTFLALRRRRLLPTRILFAMRLKNECWGYADLISKVTAGADWILADALGAEAIDPQSWKIVQGGLRESIADAAGAKSAIRKRSDKSSKV